MMILQLMFVLSLYAKPACVSVPGPMVTAGDLQGSIPELGDIAPDKPLFPAPAVGLVRQLSGHELRSILGQNARVPPGLCVERASWRPSMEDIRSAILKALPVAPKLLEVRETSRMAVPLGRLEFPLSGVAPAKIKPGDVLLWNGRLIPQSGPPVRVWARVMIRVSGQVLRLTRAKRPLEPLQPVDLAAGEQEIPLQDVVQPLPLEGVVGCVVLRAMDPGELLVRHALRCPEIRRQPAEAVVRTGSILIRVKGSLEEVSPDSGLQRFQGRGMTKAVRVTRNEEGGVEVVLP